jgi:hypothetical protein
VTTNTISGKSFARNNPEILLKAVQDVVNKQMSLRKPAAHYNIHYSVIYRHLKKKGTGTDNIKRRGGHPVLNPNEEKCIVENLKTLGEWGYLVDSFDVRLIVKYYLDSSGKQIKKFRDNIPGKDFVYPFLKRHKGEISVIMCQNIKCKRASVSRGIINQYFNRLEEELEGVPPSPEHCQMSQT